MNNLQKNIQDLDDLGVDCQISTVSDNEYIVEFIINEINLRKLVELIKGLGDK
jgi:hypothetical protein